MTKTIIFQGQTYEAPDWAKFVTSDYDGIYVWANKPVLSTIDSCFIYEDNCEKLTDEQAAICEEIK